MSEVSKQFNNLAYDNSLWEKYFPSTPNAPPSFYDQAKKHYSSYTYIDAINFRTFSLHNGSVKFTEFFQLLAAVKRVGCALRYASGSLEGNPEIVLAAVKQHGYALRYASDALKGNPEIVLAAVKQHGNVLQHASDALKGNPEIVLAAVKQHGNALRYASDELRNNPWFLIKVGMHSPASYLNDSCYCFNDGRYSRAFMMIAALPFILLVASVIFFYKKMEQVFAPFLNIPSHSGNKKRSGELATSAAASNAKGVDRSSPRPWWNVSLDGPTRN